MLARAAALTAVALAWPATAAATDLGGGSAARHALLGIRTADDGTAHVTAVVAAACGIGRAAHTVRLDGDGRFAFAVTVRTRLPDDRRVRQRARVVVSGVVAGGSASGTAAVTLRQRRGGRTVARCATGERAWQARAAAAEPEPGAPRPGGAYHGLVALDGRPAPFVLRVGAAGARVETSVFEYRDDCRRAAENVTPGAPIAADGSFRLRERFSVRWAEGRERYRVAVDGRFTPNGVNGTLSVRSVLRAPSGRVLERCSTGRRAFAAAL